MTGISFVRRLPIFVPFRNTHDGGFTLIELVVVMALIGTMLFVALPNFQHLIADETRKTSQWILLQVPKYRTLAVSKTQTCTLHVDMSDQRLWFSSSLMTEEELLEATEKGLKLDNPPRLLDVTYSYGDIINSGEAIINFYSKDYCDKAILHMESEDGDPVSFIFEPFLTQVLLEEGYVDFEE